MPVDSGAYGDPRNRLVREKYFCLRPRPLERWLWSKRISASAERVFWLHWQEGMLRGDWCSEIPLSTVARECQIDVSTVTRAYQSLSRLGCLRRTDQGRDPANPFHQATALTEIRIPRELLGELNRHPNRRGTDPAERPEQGRAGLLSTEDANASTVRAVAPASSPEASPASHALTTHPATPDSSLTDPLNGLKGRARSQAISQLIDSLSATERHAYQEALRMHQVHLAFDGDSKVSAPDQARLCQILALMARSARQNGSSDAAALGQSARHPAPAKTYRPRKLTTFELGRLSRDLQSAASTSTAPELMRQVVWSIETGALRRFDTRHALHIALKKIREGQWTRPHRMPPNWSRALSNATAPESCGHA